MSFLTRILLIVLGINAMLMLGQAAVLEINPSGAPVFFDCQGTIFGELEQNGCTTGTYVLNDTTPTSLLPSGETSVSPTTGNIFTDGFTALKNWLLTSTGLGYVTSILGAPSNFLKMMGLPPVFSFVVGALWYGLTLFLIIAFLIGRDT